jgi:hypothetical protein
MSASNTWLRFRRGDCRHAVGNATECHWLTACGLTYSRRTGEPDTRAKQCGNCKQITRRNHAEPNPTP